MRRAADDAGDRQLAEREERMGLLLRGLLVVAGAIAALFVARDAPNFAVVEGMVAVVIIAAIVLALALTRKK